MVVVDEKLTGSVEPLDVDDIVELVVVVDEKLIGSVEPLDVDVVELVVVVDEKLTGSMVSKIAVVIVFM